MKPAYPLLVTALLLSISTSAAMLIYSVPEGAELYVNSTLQGATPLTLNLETGNYSLTLSKNCYRAALNLTVNASSSEESEVLVVMERNASCNSPGEVVALQGVQELEAFETDKVLFVLNDSNASSEWFLGNDSLSVEGKGYWFEWVPGPLFTSNERVVEVKAVVGNKTFSWNVAVKFVVNPFFTSTNGGVDVQGSADTALHVMVNNEAYEFETLTAYTSTSPSFANALNHSLIPKRIGAVTEWFNNLTNLPFGNNYLVRLKGILPSGRVVVFNFTDERAHYRFVPFKDEGEKKKDKYSRRDEGFNASSELVYVVFEKDVLKKTESQLLRLDAKNFDAGVKKVEAVIRKPDGEVLKKGLSLFEGSSEYGSWMAELTGLQEGEYRLEFVIIWTGPEFPKIEPVKNRAFFVTGDAAPSIEKEFFLVYYVLSEEVVEKGGVVTVSLDAVDKEGVAEVITSFESSKGDSFKVALGLEEGFEKYGTWKGTIQADEEGATYSLKSITLKRRNGLEKTFQVKDRSFYVKEEPKNFVTGSVVKASEFSEKLARLVSNPLFPTALGFAMMLLMTSVWMVGVRVLKV